MTRTASIRDLALLSDGHTAALIHRTGSVEWYSPARFDGPSVFGRLLDKSAGYWQIDPAAASEVNRRYLPDTMMLQTTFTTATGEAVLTDALALEMGVREHRIGRQSPHILLRALEGVTGAVPFELVLCPRPDYGLSIPLIRQADDHWVIQAGSQELIVFSSVPLEVEANQLHAAFTVHAGETIHFALVYRTHRDTNPPVAPVDVAAHLHNTQQAWQSWAQTHYCYDGLYAEQVRRSALVLQALTFHPTGAIIAAPTTSLPEEIGGSRNWDYRFAWLRDLALTMHALKVATCPDEVEHYFRWIARALGDLSLPEQDVQIMYGVEGERDLTEHMLTHLDGFQDTQPVRVGNNAWFQKQLDVLGEVIDAVYRFRDRLDDTLDGSIKQLVVQLANRAADTWPEPDAGMWEARDHQRHHVSSKVMCWVALDRAIRLAPQLDVADTSAWEAARDAVHAAVLEQGWNADVQSFTGVFGSDHLDASVLLMVLVDFLPASDPRIRATIRTIERELSLNGQVYRWKGEKNTFLLCTYWLVEALVLIGDVERAQKLFEETTAYANDLGLLAEMNDPQTGEMRGNFPQAFSHIGLINAAHRLSEAVHATSAEEDREDSRELTG